MLTLLIILLVGLPLHLQITGSARLMCVSDSFTYGKNNAIQMAAQHQRYKVVTTHSLNTVLINKCVLWSKFCRVLQGAMTSQPREHWD